MRIILVGASGTIGKAVDAALSGRHEIVRVGRGSGDVRADIANRASIQRLFERTGTFDALVNTAGNVHFGRLEDFTSEEFELGLRDKLMGQVNLVTMGLKHIGNGGSFTLTSGLTNDDPIREGVSAAMVNGGLEGFVRAAAVALPCGLRVNAVSPTLIEESSAAYGPYFRGVKAIAASDVALGYVKSVEGAQTGQVYRMGWSRHS